MSSIFKSLAIGVCALMATALHSCHDDIKISSIPEGLPAKISFKVVVPTATNTTVDNSRSAEPEESIVDDFYLLLACTTSDRVEVLRLSLTEVASSVTESNNAIGYREYEYSIEDVDTKSGTYYVYALANPLSKFSKLSELDGIDKIDDGAQDISTTSFSSLDVERLMANATTSDIQLDATNFIPMSFKKADTIDIYPNTDANAAVNNDIDLGTITLERLMARIEFYLINQDDAGNDLGTFTPKTYRVYNVPKKANVISQGNNKLSDDYLVATNYFNVSTPVTISETNTYTKDSKSYDCDFFSFLMLENVQDDVTSSFPTTTIDDNGNPILDSDGNTTAVSDLTIWREYWDYSNVTGVIDPAQKTFTYAPTYSTFVVIDGYYEGLDEGGLTTYSGNVSYTIHLGDFSTSPTATSSTPGNYTVNRNELHKYRVNVKGVNSLVSESDVTVLGKVNQAVEGEITQSLNSFELDAHYEAVMLTMSYDQLKDIETLWKEGKLTLGVRSPLNNNVYAVYAQNDTLVADRSDKYILGYQWIKNDDIDYSWIEFMQPLEKGVIPRFPGYSIESVESNGDITYNMRDGRPGEIVLNQEYPSSSIYNSSLSSSEGCSLYLAGQSVTIGYLCDFCANPFNYARETSSGSKTYEVAVFVDEYVYGKNNPKNGEETLDIESWVNIENPRLIVLNPETPSTSADKQSIVNNNRFFSISQRSIKTPYDLDNVGDNATFSSVFGIETWDETSEYGNNDYTSTYGGLKVYESLTSQKTITVYKSDGTNTSVTINPYSAGTTGPAYHELYGRANTIALHSEAKNKATYYPAFFKNAGYNNRNLTNLKSDHIWKMINVPNALQAVVMRNRDLDGDGEIEDFELKWCLPAIAQFYTIWLGQTALPEETYLMDLDDFYSSIYGTSGYSMKYTAYATQPNEEGVGSGTGSGLFSDLYPHYFSSSGGDALVYWQDQGTSISSRGDLTGGWFQPYHYARAVRNVPHFNVAPEFPVDYTTKQSERVILINGLTDQFLRKEKFTGLYPPHTERDSYYNQIPESGIQVSSREYCFATSVADAKVISYDGYTKEQIQANWETILNDILDSSEFKNSEDSGKTGWRIPNQRELMLLYRGGYLTPTVAPYSYSYNIPNTFFFCSTYFTYNDIKKWPFTGINNRLNLVNVDYGSFYVVRLVRDYTPSTATYTSSGSIAGTD